MKGWTYGAGNAAHLGPGNSRIFISDAAPLIRKVIKKRIGLSGVVTERRQQLFAETTGALDQCFTKIFVMTFLSVNSMPFPFVGVGERQAVGAPFGEQKNKKRRRKKAPEISIGYQFSTVLLHDNASLAI